MHRLLQSPRVMAAQDKVLEWLSYGLSPRQIAFTLALGFAIGCIPVLGVTTAICALVAMLLRLNMAVIQAANWLAVPLQMVLLFPLIRLGQWIFAGQSNKILPALSKAQLLSRIEASPWSSLMAMGDLFAHALVAWVMLALPLLLILTLLLTPLMNRLTRLVVTSAM